MIEKFDRPPHALISNGGGLYGYLAFNPASGSNVF